MLTHQVYESNQMSLFMKATHTGIHLRSRVHGNANCAQQATLSGGGGGRAAHVMQALPNPEGLA